MPIDYRHALNDLTLDDLANWTSMGGGDVQGWLDAINAGGYDVTEREAIEEYASKYVNFYSNGDGTYTMTSFVSNGQTSASNPVNSNLSTITRGEVQTPVNVSTNPSTGKLEMSTSPASGSFGANAKYFLANVSQAVSAASVGITLGKVIDSALYNANPDYWDSIGLSTLNPETWSSITNGDDSLAAGLFNFVFGIDPDTGKTQAYLNEDALAYLAYALKNNGWFTQGTKTVTIDDTTGFPQPLIDALPFNIYENSVTIPMRTDVSQLFTYSFTSGNGYIFAYYNPNSTFGGATAVSDSAFTVYDHPNHRYENSSRLTYRSDSFYYYNLSSGSNYLLWSDKGSPVANGNNLSGPDYTWGFYSLAYKGDIDSGSLVPGTSDQTQATLPDTTTWTSIPTTLTSLQQQYPQVFSNPLVWESVQPDGTVEQMRYVPVSLPELQSVTDPTTGEETLIVSQPISSIDDSSQANPEINNDSSNDDIIDFILRLIQQNPETASDDETKTATDLQPITPVITPVITGVGDTPSIPTPEGEASALWSVYHPTQAQVDAFGGWLWTGNIITQIQQLLQNPMDGIITLHKVFATPIDSGTSTIVVGRLDSQVSSATINQQYVQVDCGSVNCYEQFGNVFDYNLTKVSLYLPFIGIVPLNVDDIMRSIISITYGVDVFTGACLAMVEITRDGHTANLYQYAGVASVEYPVTGAVHSGLLNGIFGIAGGVVGAVAASSGVGIAAGVGAAASGLANVTKVANARSGGFSGNAGAMGIKTPYLIIERPQVRIAEDFPLLDGYPTNISTTISECSGHVVCSTVHVSGIAATDTELRQIESLLKSGIEI